MKFPEHIILDFQPNHTLGSYSYWAHSYLLENKSKYFSYQSYRWGMKFLYKNPRYWTSTKFRLQKKFTLIYNDADPQIAFLSKKGKEKTQWMINKYYKVGHKLKWSRGGSRWRFDKMFYTAKYLSKEKMKVVLSKVFKKTKPYEFKDYKMWLFFDINFLRKEKIYTKLKYSRTTQYDIVSGGSAALLSGFLGFLICEKFGFELLDSGDFYYLFMYLVFLGFFTRLIVKLINNEVEIWNVLSFKWFYTFYFTIFNLFVKKIKKIFKFNIKFRK